MNFSTRYGTVYGTLRAGGIALLLALLAAGGGEVAVAAEQRTAVNVTGAEREFMLAGMRKMLASVQGIAQGLAGGDAAQVAEAARSSGMGTMAVSPALRAKLPQPFMKLSMGTHKGFDGLAALAEQGAPDKAVLERLSAVMGNCLACHAAYRLEVR